MTTPRLRFTLKEAAAYLRMPERTVQTMAKDGRLAVVWVGEGAKKPARYIFLQEDLEAWLHARRRPSLEEQRRQADQDTSRRGPSALARWLPPKEARKFA